ncbi:MAG: biotin--[Lachnospiraceae bacterium]|nr:biotin--[acetyl-CoA-carboxylase] ligase [Lachnospiraceae bacterium]
MKYTIESFDLVESTNTLLMERAACGAPEGSVIVAKSQSAGKGRSGRTFFSPGGNLYMSLLIRPGRKIEQMKTLTPMIAVCVLEAVKEVLGTELCIKWVNDLIYREKKVCGILVETKLAPDRSVSHAVIGIGVNVFSQEVPDELKDICGFLLDEPAAREGEEAAAAQEKTIGRLVEKILERFAFYYERFDEKAYMDVYKNASIVTGRRLTYLAGLKEETLEVLSITDDGELVAKDCKGRIRIYHDGEISIRL